MLDGIAYEMLTENLPKLTQKYHSFPIQIGSYWLQKPLSEDSDGGFLLLSQLKRCKTFQP